MKKPFSIRVEDNVSRRYKALSAVLNMDNAELLKELLLEKEQRLTDEQRTAYDALLKA